MLQVQTLRDERDRALEGLRKRKLEDPAATVDRIIELDDRRKSLQTENDELLAERNRLSKEIGDLFKAGKRDEATEKRERVNAIKDESSAAEGELNATVKALEDALLQIPNLPHQKVPAGNSEEDNEVYKDYPGKLASLDTGAKPHWELAEDYGIFSLELGVKTTGSGFPVFTGQGARLQRSLINFFLDSNAAAGYTEYAPPLLVNEDTARGTGQLPDKEGQMYHITGDDLYLIPTSEVPLANLYRGELLDADVSPLKLTGYTPCFRREAGSYGAHVRGLNRVHQFDKVELVEIALPENSYNRLDAMVAHVESLLDELELPYRILRLCGGDMGFTAAMTYDFEVWSAAQERWLEVSSVSNCESYQSNRLKLRYRTDNGNELLHTLNGSALALPRIIAALLENNQSEEGILLPKVLHTYFGAKRLTRK